MKTKTLGMIAAAAALYWFVKSGKGLSGLAEDIFGEEISAGGVPYNPLTQTIGAAAYPPGYQYGNPYTTVSPLTPYGPYQPSQYPYGYPQQSPYGYPQSSYPGGYGYPQSSYPYGSTYPTPQTAYPSVGGSSLLQEIEQLYGGQSAYGSPYPSSFGSSVFGGAFGTSPYGSSETAAQQLKDSYIQYGLQSGMLQQTFCGQQVSGQSQYALCTFSWTTTAGRTRTGNYTTAAAAMKRYQTTGKLA